MKSLNPYLSHVHRGQCDLSRRGFLGFTAGAVAGVATSSLSVPALASEQGGDHHEDELVASPRPIPGGVTVSPPQISPPPVLIHHFPFAAAVVPFHEPSQITDFRGFIANCRVMGRGTGRDPRGTATGLAYQVDNGFMDGRYVGLDGRRHEGTFGFT